MPSLYVIRYFLVGCPSIVSEPISFLSISPRISVFGAAFWLKGISKYIFSEGIIFQTTFLSLLVIVIIWSGFVISILKLSALEYIFPYVFCPSAVKTVSAENSNPNDETVMHRTKTNNVSKIINLLFI